MDDDWFIYATRGTILGHSVLLSPVEESIWSKGFVMERERFDGADVIHLVRAFGAQMDWVRLLRRFDRYWEVLLSHLLLFRFTYPGERTTVPDSVMSELLGRATDSLHQGNWEEKLCRGNLISSCNFQLDLGHWGYQNGRQWDEEQRESGAN